MTGPLTTTTTTTTVISDTTAVRDMLLKMMLKLQSACSMSNKNKGNLAKATFWQPRPQGFSLKTHFLREKHWGRG